MWQCITCRCGSMWGVGWNFLYNGNKIKYHAKLYFVYLLGVPGLCLVFCPHFYSSSFINTLCVTLPDYLLIWYIYSLGLVCLHFLYPCFTCAFVWRTEPSNSHIRRVISPLLNLPLLYFRQ